MSAITVPSAVAPRAFGWPRAAIMTVALLVVALLAAITLAVGAVGHTSTRTVFRTPTDSSSVCRLARPC